MTVLCLNVVVAISGEDSRGPIADAISCEDYVVVSLELLFEPGIAVVT